MTTITKSPARKSIIRQCWATAYDQEGWYPPLKDALAGLSAEEALHKTSPQAHSVRELVNHILYYKDRFLHRLEGKDDKPVYDTNDETFTEVPADYAGESWDAQLGRLDAVHRKIGEHIATLEESDLDKPAPVEPIGAQVLDLAFHDAYHTGQIVLLRKLGGKWRN
jgi:uncharacterized damage-inducible protein DinB